jgi:hypothetical protein
VSISERRESDEIPRRVANGPRRAQEPSSEPRGHILNEWKCRKDDDMKPTKTQATPQEQYERTTNQPPVDPRKPTKKNTPGSHSTGGAKDHTTPGDSEGPE